MIADGDEALGELANTVLHESVHATIYVEGQTPFNESIASFIADRLTPSYLDKTVGSGSLEARAYFAAEAGGAKRTLIFHETYEKLDALYSTNKPKDEKLAEKARILHELGVAVHARRPFNNATLVQFKTYTSGSPALEALLSACTGDVRRLVRTLKRVRSSSFRSAHASELGEALDPLARASCPP
jgi:predicted aminopeptidase